VSWGAQKTTLGLQNCVIPNIHTRQTTGSDERYLSDGIKALYRSTDVEERTTLIQLEYHGLIKVYILGISSDNKECLFVVCDVSLDVRFTTRDAADTHETDTLGRNLYVPNESTQFVYTSDIITYHASDNTQFGKYT